jgi:hypothetical protein
MGEGGERAMTTNKARFRGGVQLVAFYWGDGDWSCTFTHGARHGERAGWWAGGLSPDRYWDDTDSPCYSVVSNSAGDLDPDGALPLDATCVHCGTMLHPDWSRGVRVVMDYEPTAEHRYSHGARVGDHTRPSFRSNVSDDIPGFLLIDGTEGGDKIAE